MSHPTAERHEQDVARDQRKRRERVAPREQDVDAPPAPISNRVVPLVAVSVAGVSTKAMAAIARTTGQGASCGSRSALGPGNDHGARQRV